MNTALKGAKMEDIEIRLYDAIGGEKNRLLYEHRSATRVTGSACRSERGHSAGAAPESRSIRDSRTPVDSSVRSNKRVSDRSKRMAGVERPCGRALFYRPIGRLPPTLTGHTAKLQAINTDLEKEISERKRAEDAGHSIGRYRESSDDAIVGTTLAGVITGWNKGAELIYGYSAAEVTGRPISILIPPDLLHERPGWQRGSNRRTHCAVRDHSGAERRSSSSCF